MQHYSELKCSSDQEEHLSKLKELDGLTSDEVDRIRAFPRRPATHAFDILIRKGLLEDERTYRTVIAPAVKSLYEQYNDVFYVTGEFPDLLDLPTTHPDLFESVDLFENLDKLNLSKVRAWSPDQLVAEFGW